MDRLRNLQAGLTKALAMRKKVASPGGEVATVQNSLHRQLSRLLGREASPVVQAILCSELAMSERTRRLDTPALVLLAIERRVHDPGR